MHLQVHACEDRHIQADSYDSGLLDGHAKKCYRQRRQDVVVDFTLKPGSVSETVEVASSLPVWKRKTPLLAKSLTRGSRQSSFEWPQFHFFSAACCWREHTAS